jgi:catecholate siderophore receptor
MPWIRPTASDTADANTLITKLDPTAYFGMASDYNNGSATHGTFTHVHRFGNDNELRTTLRQAHYTRDQRAGTVRFAGTTPTATAPLTNPADVVLSNFGPSTVLNRGTQLKIQDMDTVNLLSDFSGRFAAFGLKHELQSGIDFAQEKKTVYAARNAAQGGVVPVKPQTTAGTPDDGASIDESSRVLRVSSRFKNEALGAYVQDLVEVMPNWKLLGGLRYDRMSGHYEMIAIPNAAPGPEAVTPYQQKISEWSRRFGVLFQPTDRHSFHFSYGTSFNTSGDAYSYNAQSANTPPESSTNIEIGAKLDSADRRFTTRLALFRSTKTNERNTDPDTAATALLLSGKRHTAGVEIDITGRPLPAWEIFGSYMWMPVAVVDKAAPTATLFGNREGDRPGLTPVNSGTIWNTYQFTPAVRLGLGINFRSSQSPADVNPVAGVWKAPSYVTGDLMAEYAVMPDKVILKANLSNVTNKLYADSLYRGHYIPGAGRLLQVSATLKF